MPRIMAYLSMPMHGSKGRAAFIPEEKRETELFLEKAYSRAHCSLGNVQAFRGWMKLPVDTISREVFASSMCMRRPLTSLGAGCAAAGSSPHKPGEVQEAEEREGGNPDCPRQVERGHVFGPEKRRQHPHQGCEYD
jgi:hypothetical protein